MPEQTTEAVPSSNADLTTALIALAKRDDRGKRWEVYTALVATLVGLLALAVSAYTAYVQRQQLRAQVWPYVTIMYSNLEADSSFTIANQGTGPARVIAFEMTVDGAEAHGGDDVETAAGFANERGERLVTAAAIVLPSGKEIKFMQPYDNAQSRAKFKELLPGGKHPLGVSVCYCSVLDDCWIASFGAKAKHLDHCTVEVSARP